MKNKTYFALVSVFLGTISVAHSMQNENENTSSITRQQSTNNSFFVCESECPKVDLQNRTSTGGKLSIYVNPTTVGVGGIFGGIVDFFRNFGRTSN